VSKPLLRKVYAYIAITAGTSVMINRVQDLNADDRFLALVLGVALPLLYLVPLAVFGATIRPEESKLKVSQYTEAEVSYGEVRACYSFLLPPFEMVLIHTRRQFPLNILLATDGVIGKSGTLATNVRSRMKRSG